MPESLKQLRPLRPAILPGKSKSVGVSPFRFRYETKAERRTDSAGHTYCVQEGQGKVSCNGNQGNKPAAGDDERQSELGNKPKPKLSKSPVKPPPEPKPTDKAKIAKAAHKLVDKNIQRYAEEHNEPRMAKVLGGVSLPDGEPLDILIDKGKLKGAVELKTIVDNANGKITMDSYAQVRKVLYEREHGLLFHTIVSDDTEVFASCRGDLTKCDESKRVYYYRRGIAGSARIKNLHRCKDEAELKRLMAMEEAKLPEGAKRTDSEIKTGKWVSFTDEKGKGFRDKRTGREVRAKK